jgi:RNase P subunit RPR2
MNMEVHRQTCQKCGSIDVRNILAREPDIPMTIYVRCAKCGELVARYKLREYYHHGKGIDSFLRSQAAQLAESGRHVLGEFRRTQKESVQGYEMVLKELEKEGKEV